MADDRSANERLDDALLEESLEDLYEHAPCGYVSTLPDGTFAKVNHTFLAWTGYQPDEIVGRRRFQDLLALPGKIFHETHYAPLLHMQGFVNEVAFDLLCRDGVPLPVLINTVQKRDSSGAPLLHRTTVFNATDRRTYERELQLARIRAEEALSLRDQFLALAAHELRTPLTTILGHLEILQRRVAKENTLSARDQRSLQTITSQTQRLNQLIHTLFDVSRIGTGQLTLEQEPVDICALVRQTVDDLQSALETRAIEFQSSIESAVIKGDQLRLEQVVQNLIQNALKYSPPDTPVGVTVSKLEAHVCVAVRDKGIGIPVADLPHLFNRFFRAANARAGVGGGGLGIGLYVVKEIVDLHGGQITVASTEDRGSTFTVCFPLTTA